MNLSLLKQLTCCPKAMSDRINELVFVCIFQNVSPLKFEDISMFEKAYYEDAMYSSHIFHLLILNFLLRVVGFFDLRLSLV